MFQAAIFDFDGVIIHSEDLHRKAWKALAQERNQPFDDATFLRGFGVKNELFIKEMLKWTEDDEEVQRIIHRKEKLFWDLVSIEGIHPIPGTVDLIKRLFHQKIPCAVGTSSVRRNFDFVMKFQEDLLPYFQAIITAEHVQRGKPEPDVFLQAAQALHVDPKNCIVFEDAPLGIMAAQNAGMKVVALSTTFKKDYLKQFSPDRIVDSLALLDISSLEKLFMF